MGTSLRGVGEGPYPQMPTLLLDETDAIFNPKTADHYESLRAILNSGHRRGATVSRCVDFGRSIEEFNVYCPKVLAGIGTLPDTISDRSAPIRLQRKTRAEKIDSFRRRDVAAVCKPIREKLEKFGTDYGAALGDARPVMPEELSDRMQEGCEPLVAIADALGCGTETRAALVDLLNVERVDSVEVAQVKLLRNLRDLFAATDAPAIGTTQLLLALTTGENGWGDWYTHGLDSRGLAALLRPYEVSSKSVRLADGSVVMGYHRDDLWDAWDRYLPAAVVDVVAPGEKTHSA